MAQPPAPSVTGGRRRTRTYDADADLSALTASVAALICPPGTLVATAAATEPAGDGWKLCDGQWLPIADYPRLHAILGSAWGESTTQFRLPDLRGRALIGAGGVPALALGDLAGASEIMLSVANLPPHAHAVADPGHGHAVLDPGHAHAAAATGAAVPAGTGLLAALAGSTGVATTGVSVQPAATGVTVEETGEGEPVPILPPVLAVNWLVRT